MRSAPALVRSFDRVVTIERACRRGVVLRYEDLIHDFDGFVERLTRHVKLERSAVQGLHERSRPRADECLDRHHRSGRTEGFREKLRGETIATLNEIFAPVLERHGYAP